MPVVAVRLELVSKKSVLILKRSEVILERHSFDHAARFVSGHGLQPCRKWNQNPTGFSGWGVFFKPSRYRKASPAPRATCPFIIF